MKQFKLQDDWQIQEINKAIHEANAGDFATEAEVRAVIDRWKVAKLTKNGENPATKAPPRRNV